MRIRTDRRWIYFQDAFEKEVEFLNKAEIIGNKSENVKSNKWKAHN